MRLQTFAIVSLSILPISGCTHNNSVVDYNPDTNFSELKHYQFKQTTLKTNNSLMANRIEEAIRTTLKEKHLSQTQPADIIINYYLNSITTEIPGSRGSIGIGGGRSNVGVGITLDIPIGGTQNHQLEQLTIDFIDTKNNELLWRGVDSFKKSINSPEKNNTRIQKTVESILENYPPKP